MQKNEDQIIEDKKKLKVVKKNGVLAHLSEEQKKLALDELCSAKNGADFKKRLKKIMRRQGMKIFVKQAELKEVTDPKRPWQKKYKQSRTTSINS